MTISRRCFPCTGKSHGTIGASRRWGGRRIQRSSMSAGCGRAMKPGRRRGRGASRAGMDPARLLAARLQERVADVASRGAMSAPRRRQQWCRRDPSKARMQGRQSEGERKMTTRDSLSRRNGTHCNTTGRARLSRALPLNSPPIRGEARALVRVTDTDSSPDSPRRQRPFATPAKPGKNRARNQPSNAVPHRLDLRGSRL